MSWRKRFFDLLVVTLSLVITLPVMVLVGLVVYWVSGRPILFRQLRVGHRGRPFHMLKFRTMIRGAESQGPLLTVSGDLRITGIGAKLRAWKLDELPQLLNVLRGDMSLVGPRPEVSRFVSLYSDEQRRVLNLKPGLTDPASIVFKNESELLASKQEPEQEYINSIMPEKIRLNLEYANRATVRSDLAVLFRTAWNLWAPHH